MVQEGIDLGGFRLFMQKGVPVMSISFLNFRHLLVAFDAPVVLRAQSNYFAVSVTVLWAI